MRVVFFQRSAYKYPNMAISVINLRIIISFYWGYMLLIESSDINDLKV